MWLVKDMKETKIMRERERERERPTWPWKD